MNKRKTSFIIFIISMIFFYLPLLILIINSFNSGKGSVWQGFSLRWYKELFLYSDNIWTSFKYSLIIGFL